MSSEPRVVVITGGSRGLGAGLVQSYLDSGDLVATCSRSSTARGREVAAGPATPTGSCSRPPTCRSRPTARASSRPSSTRWDHVDVLINNAGVARDGILGMTTDEDIDTVVDLNLKGTLYMSRLVSRRMLARRSGSIVNISSDRRAFRLPRPGGLQRDQGRPGGADPGAGPRARLARHPRQRDRAGLPAHRDEPRPRRGPAPADRAAYAGRPARRARRHRPGLPVPHRSRATTTSPGRCW